MPKTGTTAIQSVLFSSRQGLAEQGVFYPDFGDNQHIALVRKIAREAGSTIPFPPNGDPGPYHRFTQLLDEQVHPPHTSIISSENFFQRPACLPGHHQKSSIDPFDLLKTTIEATAKYFEGCEVFVVMWLRRQDNWLMSMYNETIKTSLYTGSFNDFSDHLIGAHLLKVVQLWIGVFGKQRIVCRSYDTLSKNKVNVVDSFLDTVCPEVNRTVLNNRDVSKNLSLSNEAIWLKKRINALVKDGGGKIDRADKQKIYSLLAQVTSASPEPGRPLLTSAERKALMGRYLADNQRLVEELACSELLPLVNLDDLDELAALERQGRQTRRVNPCRHSIDQIIKTLVLNGQPLAQPKHPSVVR